MNLFLSKFQGFLSSRGMTSGASFEAREGWLPRERASSLKVLGFRTWKSACVRTVRLVGHFEI